MEGLDYPMQTKALNLFWHKAELRLVEQPEPEAPVFAISRPTFFGGTEEFLLQYPAQLESPTKRDLARHRFTVRHGKKRRSFQAPDAATFKTWLSALEQAFELKRDSEHFNTSNSTTTTATATSSQGRESIAGCTGTWTSNSTHTSRSVEMAPPSTITVNRQCYKRDPSNYKLLWLHRPASVVKGSEVNEDEREKTVQSEEEEDYINIFASEDTQTATDSEHLGTDCDQDEDDMPSVKSVEDSQSVPLSSQIKDEIVDVEPEVQVIVEELVTGLVKVNNDTTVNESVIESKVSASVETLVVKTNDDCENDLAVNTLHTRSTKANSRKSDSATGVSTHSASLLPRHKWMPLDPTSSSLIWVRSSLGSNDSATRSNSRRRAVKPARKWVPMDSNNTRYLWSRRVENAAVRLQSRYKATS